MPFDLKELERLGSQDVPYEHSMDLPEYRAPEVEDPAFDLDELIKLGEVELYGEEPGYGKVALKGMARGAQNIASGIGSITRWAGDVMDSPVISEAGRTASEFWREGAQEGWEAPDPRIFKGTFMQKPSLKRALGIISEAFPSYGAAITASMASGSPFVGAAFLGAIEGAPQYEEAREAGKGLGEASAYGAASTIGTALLEYLPISRMLKFKGGMGKAALRGGLEESAQEATQTVWQNLIAKVGYDDTRNLAEGIIESMIGGFGLGAPAGAVTSRVNRAIEKARQAGATDEEIAAATEDLEKQVEDHAEEVKRSQPVDLLEPKPKASRQAIQVGDQAPPTMFDEIAHRESQLAEEEQRKKMEAEEQLARFEREIPATFSTAAKQTLAIANDFMTRAPNMPLEQRRTWERLVDRAQQGDPDALYDVWVNLASKRGVQKPVEARTPEAKQWTQESLEAAKARVAGAGGAVQGEPQRATIEDQRGPKVVPQMPGMEQTAAEVDLAAVEAETEPTEAQKEAGNYKKGHIKIHGLDISIENPRGSTRTGKDKDGNEWASELTHHYGYFRRSEGKDGDQIDTFIGPNPESPRVFVVDQLDPDSWKFDEHKVMLGFNSREEAVQGYLDNYEDGWQGLGEVTETSVEGLKQFVGSGRQNKPFAEVTGDQTLQGRVVRPEREGQEPRRAIPIEGRGEEAAEAGRVFQKQEKEKVRPRTKAQAEAEKPAVEMVEGYPVDKLAETEVEVKAIDEKGDVYAVAERADKAIRDIDEQTETYYSILECVG